MRKNPRSYGAIGIACGLAFATRTAQGAPQTFAFGGTIDFVSDTLGFDPSASAGAPFFGSYTFEIGWPDSNPDDSRVGSYRFGPAGRMVIQIGNYEFATNDLVITVGNDLTGEDLYRVGNASPFFAAGHQWNIAALFLRDLTATAFSNDTLPTAPPELEAFGYERSIGFVEFGHDCAIRGTLSSLTPEPSSGVILGTGVVLLLRRKRRVATVLPPC